MINLDVTIMDQPYRLSCQEGGERTLREAVHYLDSKMKALRDSGKVKGNDRIAVMAALNMANELLRLRKQDAELQGAVSGRVKNMRERVEATLQRTRQLDL